MDRMKLTVTIDVDTEQWAEEYGVPTSAVAADVRKWCSERLHRYDDNLARVVTVR